MRGLRVDFDGDRVPDAEPRDRGPAGVGAWAAGAVLVAIAIAGFALALCSGVAQYRLMRAAENLTDAPPIAAVMNLRAYEAYPFDPHVRLQLFKTMVRGHSTELVNASPKVMDRLYAMARQLAHDQAGLLLARIHYLTKAGRCADECVHTMNTLLDLHGRQWVIQNYATKH